MKFGVQHRACPYYGSKELQSKADIVFLPYNYLIDSHSRKAQNIDVANAIIIFDEAHNLESVCTEATSFELNTGDLTGTNAEIRICMDILAQNPAAAITPKDLSDLAGTRFRFLSEKKSNCAHCTGRLQKLATEIIKIPLQGDKNKTRESVQSGEFVYEMMDRAGINFDNSAEIIRLLEMVNEMLSQGKRSS